MVYSFQYMEFLVSSACSFSFSLTYQKREKKAFNFPPFFMSSFFIFIYLFIIIRYTTYCQFVSAVYIYIFLYIKKCSFQVRLS